MNDPSGITLRDVNMSLHTPSPEAQEGDAEIDFEKLSLDGQHRWLHPLRLRMTPDPPKENEEVRHTIFRFNNDLCEDKVDGAIHSEASVKEEDRLFLSLEVMIRN